MNKQILDFSKLKTQIKPFVEGWIMPNQFLQLLKRATLWHILWFSMALSGLLMGIIVVPMSFLYKGRIAYDYLITGGICAFCASLSVAAILVLLIKELRENEKTLKELNQKFLYLSTKDKLTGVYNRRYFYEKLEEEIKRANRYKNIFSLIMLRIDCFKDYKDIHGYKAGDSLLRDFALLLRKNVREQDFVARYGREEFSLILPETGKRGAMSLIERIKFCLSAQSFQFKETMPGGKLTISLGIATFPDDAKSLDEIVIVADRGLYKLEENDMNRIEFA